MFPSRWGIENSPFRGVFDPKNFFQSPTHEEALARLGFLVAQHHRLGLLIGPGGSGKSLLLDVFARELREGKISRREGVPVLTYPQVACLSLLDVEPTEMLSLLAVGWGLSVEPSQSAASLWRALGDRMIEYRYQQIEAVVLFDDADRADRQTLLHIARLARFDASPEMRMTIVLAGRNEGMARLDDSLLGLAELRIELEPWQRDDTEQYVNTLLSRAGRQSRLFAEPAIDRLQELSQGIPRRAAQLADLALLAGAGQNLDQIDAGVVEGVYQELGVGK